MTNKEAIYYLKEIKLFDVEIPNDYQKEALDIVIDALYKPTNVKGEWVAEIEKDSSIHERSSHKCSICGAWEPCYAVNFCPNCGADMRGE